MGHTLRAALMFWCVFQSLLNCAFTQQQNIGVGTQGNCIVKNGRDGVPGPSGPSGRPGQPGRDGRDCSINWSLNKVFEMEKQFRKIDSKCEFMAKAVEEMKHELTAHKRHIQNLLKTLAEKKILDTALLKQESIFELTTTQVEALPELSTTPSTTAFILPTDEQNLSLPVHKSAKSLNDKSDCEKQLVFHVYDEVETRGAVNMEIFNISGNTYLAVTNFHSPPDGYNTMSSVYKMNSKTEKFEILQALPTIGCRSISAFSDGGESYLAVSNHFESNTYALDSVVYKWNGTKFAEFVKIPTSGASAAQFFVINGESYLVFANYRNKTSVSIFSLVYKWKGGKIEVFQKLSTHGAVDCKFYRRKTGEMFLVFANYYAPSEGFNVKSVVYRWDGMRFVFAQNVSASAAIGVDLFEGEPGLFLALASHRTASSWHSHTNVFLWNGTKFVLFQELDTTAATKVHHFYFHDKLYLTVANYFDEITNFQTHSMVYEFNNIEFVRFQGIPTMGAYDLQPFTYRGAPYLAAAFRFNGEHNRLKSKIYKMYKGCLADEDALP